MSIIVFNRRIRITIGRKQLLLLFGLMVGWATLVASDFKPEEAALLLGIICLVLKFTTKPLSRVIGRLEYSIRWKFEVGISIIAGLFLIVTLIQIGAMNIMHSELHEIQDLGAGRPFEVLRAVNSLEDTHCCWSTILSVVNRSGKMSVYERTDIDGQRTEQVTGLERSVGAALVPEGGSRGYGGE